MWVPEIEHRRSLGSRGLDQLSFFNGLDTIINNHAGSGISSPELSYLLKNIEQATVQAEKLTSELPFSKPPAQMLGFLPGKLEDKRATNLSDCVLYFSTNNIPLSDNAWQQNASELIFQGFPNFQRAQGDITSDLWVM